MTAVACLSLAGCSIDDLMFWKKNKGEEQQQKEDTPKKKWDIEPEITGGSEEA